MITVSDNQAIYAMLNTRELTAVEYDALIAAEKLADATTEVAPYGAAWCGIVVTEYRARGGSL